MQRCMCTVRSRTVPGSESVNSTRPVWSLLAGGPSGWLSAGPRVKASTWAPARGRPSKRTRTPSFSPTLSSARVALGDQLEALAEDTGGHAVGELPDLHEGLEVAAVALLAATPPLPGTSASRERDE